MNIKKSRGLKIKNKIISLCLIKIKITEYLKHKNEISCHMPYVNHILIIFAPDKKITLLEY